MTYYTCWVFAVLIFGANKLLAKVLIFKIISALVRVRQYPQKFDVMTKNPRQKCFNDKKVLAVLYL